MLRNKRMALFLRNPDGDGGAGGGAAGGNGDGSGEGEKKFTQADLDRLLGERAKRAEASATTELLKKFGVEKVEDVQTALDEFKKLKDAQKSELEKAQQEAKDAQAKIDAAEKAKADALAAAQTKLLRAAVIAEAVKQNFDEAEISSVWLALQQDKKLFESMKPSADDDAEFENVDKAVAEIAKAHPKWLKSTDAQKTNINAQNRSGGKKETDEERKQREQELAARYRIK